MSLVLEDPASIDVVEAELVSKANSLIAHLEALVVTLEHRKPVKNNSVMGIHVSEDHEDDDEEAEADEDGEKDPGATEKLDDDSSEMPRTSAFHLAYMTSAELAKLQREVSSRGSAVLARIPGPLLKTTLSHLDAHVNAGLQVQVVKKGLQVLDKGGDLTRWIDSGEGKRLLQQLKDALQAGEIMLGFLTSEGVDRTVVSEERIEKGCGLFKHLVQGLLVPAHNEANVQGDEDKANKGNNNGGRGSAAGRGGKAKLKEQTDDVNDKSSGSVPEASTLVVSRGDVKPLARALLRVCDSGGGLSLMERLEVLVVVVRLDDRLLLTLSASALACLPVKCCDTAELPRLVPLQQHALGLLRGLFSHYEHHRLPVIDDLFGVMLNMPTSKKLQRTFKLHNMAKGLLHGGTSVGSGGEAGGSAGEVVDSIQSITALIMLLVQSCVTEVDLGESHASSLSNKGDYLRESGKVSNYLIKQLLVRCQKKEEGTEFRPILSLLVDDLLAACLLPDWPGAETLLSCLTFQLINDLKTHSGGSKGDEDGKAADAGMGAGGHQYLALALELLGRICTQLRVVVRVDREHPLVLPEAVDIVNHEAGPLDEHETVGCPCGLAANYGDLMMLDCDRCHRWFHGPCMGISESSQPTEWNCQDCKITQLVARQRDVIAKKREIRMRISGKGEGATSVGSDDSEEDLTPLKLSPKKSKKKSAKGGGRKKKQDPALLSTEEEVGSPLEVKEPVVEEVDAGEIEDRDIFRQLLLNYLGERAHSEPWIRQARQYHLAHWLQDYEDTGSKSKSSSLAAHFADQWALPSEAVGLHQRKDEAWLESSSKGACLDEHGTARVVRSLIVKGSFVGRFDDLLVRLLHLLGDNTPTLRTKVVKAVSAIVEADPVLMANESIHTAIIQRFYDSSISVRQAAVDLVGRFALLTPSLLEQYYDAMVDRLKDTGVSVRKSVVKILRDALLKHPNFSRRSHICHLLVQRASSPKEEDSIKDLVRRTFEQLWFDDRHADEVFAASAAFAASASSASSAAAVSPRGDVSLCKSKGSAGSGGGAGAGVDLVGRRVKKFFQAWGGAFEGRITKYLSPQETGRKSSLWRVTYDSDNTIEEYSLSAVNKILLPEIAPTEVGGSSSTSSLTSFSSASSPTASSSSASSPSSSSLNQFQNADSLVVLLQDNPRTPGSKAWERYEKYKGATTVAEVKTLGATQADLRNDADKGFLVFRAGNGGFEEDLAEEDVAAGAAAVAVAGTAAAAMNDIEDSGAGGLEDDDREEEPPLPAGWSTEPSAAGLTFVSPKGQRCFSEQEAFELARRERASLAPTRSSSTSVASSSGKKEPDASRVRASAAQLVEVVHGVAKNGNSDWLVALLKGMLVGLGGDTKAKAEEKKRRVMVTKRCTALVKCCVDFLLTLEESGEAALPFSFVVPIKSEEAAGAQAASSSSSSSSSSTVEGRAAAMVGILSTLHVFCKASPALLVYEHIEVLLPYLKADNHIGSGAAPEAEVCRLVANMVTWALPLSQEQKRDVPTLKRAVGDLKKLTYKFGPEVVHASVECLAVIAMCMPPSMSPLKKKTADKKAAAEDDAGKREGEKEEEEALMTLANQFYKVLRARVDLTTFEKADLGKVQRGLVVLGSVCRFRRARAHGDHDDDLDAELEDDEDDDEQFEVDAEGRTMRREQAATGASAPATTATTLPEVLSARNLRSACYRVFTKFLDKGSPVVAQNALRGLSSQLIGSPRLMLLASRDGVVGSVLKHPSPLVRLEALYSWRQILEAEEHRVESGLARRQMQNRMQDADKKPNKPTAKGGQKSGGVRFGEAADDEEPEAEQESEEEERDKFEENFQREQLEVETMATVTRRQVQGDQDADSSVVGGVLQVHVASVQNLLFESSSPSTTGTKIRSAAAALLAVMLRQGLVNPLQVLPSVVALLGDAEDKLRSEGLRLLLVEDEKHPEFLKQRFVEGVALAFSLQTRVSGVARPLVRGDSSKQQQKQQQSIFAGVYSQCIRQNRAKRQGILKSLLSLFEHKRAGEVKSWMKNSQAIGSKVDADAGTGAASFKNRKGRDREDSDVVLDLSFLSFLAQTLCFLPYDVQEEALFVINHVSRFVSYEGSALLKRFHTGLVDAGVNVAEDSEDELEDDDNEGGGNQSPTKKQKGGEAASSSGGDQSIVSTGTATPAPFQLRQLGCESVAVCMLLRVKHYLKEVYHLSNAKCTDYAPSEATKANEKAIFRPDEMPNLVLPPAALVESVSGGAHLTVEGAADLLMEFKRLMREDPADFKLHAPTKKGGRKRQGENADAAGGAGVDESMPAVMREAAEKTKAAVKKANSGKGRASATAAAKKKKVSKAKAKKKKESGGDSDDDEEGVDSGVDSDYGG